MFHRILLTMLVSAGLGLSLGAAEEESDDGDSSTGLPKAYADKYLIASNTLSPDGKIGVIYPKTLCDEGDTKHSKDECKDYLVTLKPFQILAALDTASPHFKNKNHGGISGDWLKDGSAVLVILASKWGPGDVFLFEFADGNLTRSTNLLAKIREILMPDFNQAKAQHYSDSVDFIFEGDARDMCRLEPKVVRISALATTDPKHTGGVKAWDARAEAVWDIKRGRFTSKRATTMFAGVRKQEE